MRELELDGIHDDGDHAILIDSDGERYTLRIDDALRAAVRRDRPALGMIQAADATGLRPREIQAMLRAGRGAEEIAELASVSVEHVRRYEGPVLAEREFAAEQARTYPVGRGGPALGTVVAERLAARQADSDVAWDAWRRDDGTWTLELSFSAAGRTRQAHWVADMTSRSIAPMDDEARWISDEDAPPEPARGRARLSAVKSSVYDLEADGAFDPQSPRPRRGPLTAGSDRPEHPSTFDEAELDALNARRGLRPVPPLAADDAEESASVWSTVDEDPAPSAEPPRISTADGEAAVEHSADQGVDLSQDDEDDVELEDTADMLPPVAGEDSAAPEHAEWRTAAQGEEIRQQDTVDLQALPGFEEASEQEADQDEAAAGSADPADDEAEHAAEQVEDVQVEERKPSKPRSRRASMPSWDEIVFGSKGRD